MNNLTSTSILTDASISGVDEFVVGWTFADVGALLVNTSTKLADIRLITLVNVRAVTASVVQMVAVIADTSEHAKYIFALAVHAEVAKHVALVDIDACLLVVNVRVHETHLAIALEGAWEVETLPIFTERGILRAFVDVFAEVAISPESSVTDALEGAVSVDALGVLVTAAVVGETLVDITARFPVS